MSATLAGKFQDHYLVLGVEPKSDSDGIRHAYHTLAVKFHPDNRHTGDEAKFAAITLAFEVLSDPESRRVFDTVRGGPEQESAPRFSGQQFFDALASEAGRRAALMCVLYDRRRQKPSAPSLAVRQLDVLLNISPDDLTFTLWYLKQRGLVRSDDKSSLHITVEGMEFLEKNLPSLDAVLPFLKSA
jgi:curved DNA-binding protein CbpA